MTRTLGIKLFIDSKTGSLAITVVHSETDADDGSTEKHAISKTDLFGSDAAIKAAVDHSVAEYLGRVREDAKLAQSVSPIEKAARG